MYERNLFSDSSKNFFWIFWFKSNQVRTFQQNQSNWKNVVWAETKTVWTFLTKAKEIKGWIHKNCGGGAGLTMACGQGTLLACGWSRFKSSLQSTISHIPGKYLNYCAIRCKGGHHNHLLLSLFAKKCIQTPCESSLKNWNFYQFWLKWRESLPTDTFIELLGHKTVQTSNVSKVQVKAIFCIAPFVFWDLSAKKKNKWVKNESQGNHKD